MKRLIVYFFPLFLCGVIIYNYMNYYLMGAVITALFLIVFIKKYKYKGLFCIIFLLLGFFTSALHAAEFDKTYVKLVNSKAYSGYIIEKDSNNYVVRNYKQNYKVILSSYKDISGAPGDYIIFNGKVSEKPNYKKKILNSKGIDAYIKTTGENITIQKSKNVLLFPTKLKYKINNALIGINAEGGSFVSGLVTGYTKEMTEDTLTNFQDLGISHILAVSGFNVGIIFYFMLLITKKLNAKTRYMITFAVCFIYTAMGGFEPSITRAFLMISIAIGAKLINKFYDIVSGITLAAFIMLLVNSFYIFNIGFLLSFIATYGIILLNKDIEDKVPEKLHRFKSEISVGLSAFLSTLPLMLWYRGSFSLITIIINIIVSPFVGFVTILSFLSALFYSILNFKIILYPSVFIGVLFIKLINFISKYNIMVCPGRPSYFFIIMYYICIGVYFGYIKIKTSHRNKKIINIFLCSLVVISLFFHSSYLKVHFLNVGQGDSIFIETPNRKTILVDTGPTIKDFSALKDRVLPYIRRCGYNKLDILILTHFHNDHAGDYQYLLDNYAVDKVLTYKKPPHTPYNFIEVSSGDIIKVGDLTINVLFPEGNIQNIDDVNETCLVMNFKYKNFSMLLTADAEKKEMDLIKGNYDIFKIPHHGSVKSFSTSMLNSSNIGIAVISVGKNNFGHPSKLVLDMLSKRGIKTYRTDLDGNITITTQGENYKAMFQ